MSLANVTASAAKETVETIRQTPIARMTAPITRIWRKLAFMFSHSAEEQTAFLKTKAYSSGILLPTRMRGKRNKEITSGCGRRHHHHDVRRVLHAGPWAALQRPSYCGRRSPHH